MNVVQTVPTCDVQNLDLGDRRRQPNHIVNRVQVSKKEDYEHNDHHTAV